MAKPTLLERAEAIPMTGTLGDTINVGDEVYTFTSNGDNTLINKGIYRGTVASSGGRYWDQRFIIEREDGRTTAMHYNSVVPITTTLEQLVGRAY